MKKEKSKFHEYEESLLESDRLRLRDFFSDVKRHIMLTPNYRHELREDFEKAFLYYVNSGVGIAEAAERLDPCRLGGFYSRPPVLWYHLDDAAKIYPLSLKRNQMSVFRLSAYMKQPVVPELLQIALTFVIKRFPSFATTVKVGFFWHYIDTTKRRFMVEPETNIPCRPLNVSSSGSQSFRVVYFKNRISVEFFHILTDGTGGMVFLKTLVAEYLRLCGADIPCGQGVLDIDEIPSPEETSNDFPKVEPTERKSGFMGKPAVQLSGRLSTIKPCQILHFEVDSLALRSKAREKGASVTSYTLALLFMAHRYATDERTGNVQIQVPVNMRKFYESNTLRNFSMYCSIGIPIAELTSVDDIIPNIDRQLKEKASKEAMNEMMNATVSLVRILRYVPLFIKRPIAGFVYGFLGDKIFSNTLSNLGVVEVPPEMAEHIEKFDFVLGTSVTNRVACSMITFGDTAVLSVAKYTADPTYEEKLYRLLRDDGLDVTVKGSVLYES